MGNKTDEPEKSLEFSRILECYAMICEVVLCMEGSHNRRLLYLKSSNEYLKIIYNIPQTAAKSGP